ncbi:hypothetical protein ABZT03_06780 [Streptomyces sp. NPDC005574]|uniref:hypothetical protein n=1 Tax=Streptomyces sp. NPDC005574 TaxID=3156891 RepID=UPI0033AC5991
MRRVEAEHLWPNAVSGALSHWEWAFRQPRRYLSGPVESPDVEDARDTLEMALCRLPGGARADLGRLVERIDAEFVRRTLPDPTWEKAWAGAPRWWRRVREW